MRWWKTLAERGRAAGELWRIIHEGSDTPLFRRNALRDLAEREATKDYLSDWHSYEKRKMVVFIAHFILGYTGVRVVREPWAQPLPRDMTLSEVVGMAEQRLEEYIQENTEGEREN